MNAVTISPQEAVALGSDSTLAFGRLFLPRTFRQPSPGFHSDMGMLLDSPSRYNEFLCFRGSAKTSLLRTFTLKRIAYAISRTVMYTSSSQGHAIHSIRWLKHQVEHNKLLSVFGLRPGSKWTDEWIQIYHGVDELPINIFAVGITGQIRGFNLDDYRPDLIIGDDVLDEENSATIEQRAKVEDRWNGGLMQSLAPPSEAPWAKAVLAQTPFNNHDLSIKCSKDPAWRAKVYGCFNENGESRWPERFPTEWLLQEKASYIARGQYRIWMREMECQVVAAEDKAFNIERLQYYTAFPEGLRKVITIDPASSDSKRADQNVVLVLGCTNLDFFVLAYDAATGVMPDKTAARFFEYVVKFAPIQQSGVEQVAFQRTLKWFLEQEMMKRRLFVPLQGIDVKTRKPDRIIGAISGLLNYGHLHIHSSMTELVTQLDMYDPEDKDADDDIIDALAMGIVLLNPAIQGLVGSPDDAIDVEFSRIEESTYKTLEFGGCP